MTAVPVFAASRGGGCKNPGAGGIGGAWAAATEDQNRIATRPEITRDMMASADVSGSLTNSDAALLAHELLHVIRTARPAAGGPAGLPAAERVDAGPRAGRRARAAVDV